MVSRLLRSMAKAVAFIGSAGLVLATSANALPRPGVRAVRPTSAHGFNLFAGVASLAYGVNRINCGIVNNGTNCVDPTGSPVNENGFWPKGTQDNYVFNSGLQIAGFVPNITGFPWSGDTIGAFFFDPRGDQHHGEGITNIFDAGNNDDVNNWPSAGMVTDTGLYNSVLIGRKTLSQEDLWVRYWDGNPSLATGRKHSMGLLVDQRILGWNFPSGNQDIIYVIVHFINITSNRAADYNGLAAFGYSAQDIADIYAVAQNWRATAQAAYNVTIPDSGFAWTNLYASYAEDPDIGDAGNNYSNGDLIFNTVAAYKANFAEPTWVLPTSIFAAPFAAAPGFMGIKYLATPGGLGITMSGNTTNGLPFPDAVGVPRLWRNLSGNLLPTDGSCSVGSAAVAKARRMCYWAQTSSDTRMFAASGPFTILPGQLATIAAALVWAAPVASLPAAAPGVIGNQTIGALNLQTFINAGNMVPGLAIDGTRLKNNADTVRNVDRAMGFVNYSDVNGDGTITQDEVSTVPRSILGKELVAQAVFDNKFLLPFAPEAPGFFLVPGDGLVTVAWQKSTSETNGVGNPFFQIAAKPTVDCPPPNPTHIQCPNSLYDPNFRQFDVEGYRIYRGRTQAAMQVIAQFDYSGTTIADYTAEFYDPTIYGGACAPELGIQTSCPRTYVPTPGNPSVFVTSTTPVNIALTSPVLQIPPGGRVPTAVGNPPACPCNVQNNVVDTAITGGGTGFPPLTDAGVPFAYADHGVLNGVRYFYAVTAFSINSLKSGPSSLESPLVTKTVIPRVNSGQDVAGTIGATTYLGRGTTTLDPNAAAPTLDATTGEFSGSQPPSGNLTLGFPAFLPDLLAAGSYQVTVDSVQAGSWFTTQTFPAVYWFTAQGVGTTAKFSIAITGAATSAANDVTASGTFAATGLSTAQSARFGGDSTYALYGSATVAVNGDYRYTNKYRGLVNGDPGAGVATGPRWWVGAGNENVADPNGINCLTTATFSCALADLSRNAGQIAGVGIFYIASYGTIGTTEPVRSTEGVTSTVFRAADFKWYWGTNGAVDSVIDVTHNVPVPFENRIGPSWGIVNDSSFLGHVVNANKTLDSNINILTWGDMTCVTPAPRFVGSCGGVANFTGTDSGAVMQNHARLSPVVFKSSTAGGLGALATGGATGNGFMLYLDGQFFLMQMAALPAAGTVWNMRSYAGNITGNKGSYAFVPASRPAAVPGLRAQLAFTGSTFAANVTNDSLLQHVHTVPDPYYVTTSLEQTVNTKILRFVNLPSQAIIRIYSASGVLVNIVTHNDPTGGSEAVWDLRNRNNQFVASGVYFYHVETNDGHSKIGRFTVVNFAQ